MHPRDYLQRPGPLRMMEAKICFLDKGRNVQQTREHALTAENSLSSLARRSMIVSWISGGILEVRRCAVLFVSICYIPRDSNLHLSGNFAHFLYSVIRNLSDDPRNCFYQYILT